MLSKEKLAALEANIDAWATEQGVPQTVIDLVYEMAQDNPRTQEEKIKCCQQHLWSTELIEWYDRFVDYLVKTKTPETGATDIMANIETAIKLLQEVLEGIRGRNA